MRKRIVSLRCGAAWIAVALIASSAPAQTLLYRAHELTPGAGTYGAEITSLGDPDGDGLRDLVSGSPTGADCPPQGGPCGPFWRGEVRVYSSADGSLLRQWVGAGPGDLFGTDVVTLGDLDGDGRDEVLVGLAQGLAVAWIVYGDGTLRELHTPNMSGIALSDVAVLGDVDGDGKKDLAVGLTAQLLVYSSRDTPFLSIGEGALAGDLGAPTLDGSGDTVANDLVTLTVAKASPFSLVTIVLGNTIPWYSPQIDVAGGALVATPTLLLNGISDAQGALSVSGRWPPLPPGAMIYAQAWVADPSGPFGWTASEGLQLTTLAP